MKTEFTLDTTAVKAKITMHHVVNVMPHYASGTLAYARADLDFPDHTALISMLRDLNKSTGWMLEVAGTDNKGEFTARIDSGGAVVEHTIVTGSGVQRTVTGRDVNTKLGSVNDTAQCKYDDKRAFLNMNFEELEINVMAKCMVDPDYGQQLSDYLGKVLVTNLLGRPITKDTLLIAEGLCHQTLRKFCEERMLSPEWFVLDIPGITRPEVDEKAAAELEATARKSEKEAKRKARVSAGIARALRTVRRSHMDTLTHVMGDTDAAEAVLREIEAHLNVYYCCADKVTFNDGREHAESLINGYISDKIESLTSTTVVNNVNINIDKDADVEMIQKVCGELSTTELKTNGALAQNQQHDGNAMEVTLKGCSLDSLAPDITSHTHKGEDEPDSPFLKGKFGAERVQWLIDNVADSYLAPNLEMYCDMEDLRDWIRLVYQKKADVLTKFKELYGFDPLSTHYVTKADHCKALDELNGQLEQSQAEHKRTAVKLQEAEQAVDNLSKQVACEIMSNLKNIAEVGELTRKVVARDVTISNQIQVIDKQNTNITGQHRALSHSADMLMKVRNVLDGKI